MWIAKWLSMNYGQSWNPVWLNKEGTHFKADLTYSSQLKSDMVLPIFSLDILHPRDPNRLDQGDKPK